MYAEEKRRKISVQLDQSEIMDYASGNALVYRLKSSKNNVLISCSSDYCCSWVYPRLSQIREVSAQIAAEVAGIAYREGLAQREKPEDILADIREQMFQPLYPHHA